MVFHVENKGAARLSCADVIPSSSVDGKKISDSCVCLFYLSVSVWLCVFACLFYLSVLYVFACLFLSFCVCLVPMSFLSFCVCLVMSVCTSQYLSFSKSGCLIPFSFLSFPIFKKHSSGVYIYTHIYIYWVQVPLRVLSS